MDFEKIIFWILFPIIYLSAISWLVRAKRVATSKILLLAILGYFGAIFIPFLLDDIYHKSLFTLAAGGSFISIAYIVTLIASFIFLLFKLKNTDIISAVFFYISFFLFAFVVTYYGSSGEFTWELGLQLLVIFSYFGFMLVYLGLCSSWELKRKKERELKKQLKKFAKP